MPLLLPKTASKNIWSFQNATVPQRSLLIFHWLDGEKIFLNQFCISSQAHSLPLGFKGHRKQLQFVQIISPKFCWQKEEKKSFNKQRVIANRSSVGLLQPATDIL